MLLCFAQFVREVTGEHIRDKIAARSARPCGWEAPCRSASRRTAGPLPLSRRKRNLRGDTLPSTALAPSSTGR
jgi:hypothetical protein